MQSQDMSGNRSCVSCGRPIAFDANVCPYCGHDYRVTMAGPLAKKQPSSMPVAGGVLILIGGVILLIATFWCIVTIALGALAILGGIFAIQRTHFAIALVGGILSVPSIIGLIGLILVVVSKDEFTS